MNKKILILTMTLMSVVILMTPLIGTAQACRFRRRCKCLPFTATNVMSDPNSDPPGYTIPGTTEFFGPKILELVSPTNPEGHKYMVVKGTVLVGVLNSDQLGKGIMTSTCICHIFNMETGEGSGLYMFLFEFDNDKCVGTIEGIMRSQTTTVFPDVTIVAKVLLVWGTGDLAGTMISSNYNAVANLITGLVVGEFEGTIWNWTP